MKFIYKHITLIILSVISIARVDAEDITAQADSAYNGLAYSQALDLYNQAVDSLGASSDLYYNIGNTYYRLNDLGHAVIWYERALQLDPTNKDARFNLQFVNTRIADKPVNDASLISKAIDKIIDSAHPDSWATITVILFALTLASIVGYLITKKVVLRKTFFFGGAVLLLMTVISLSISFTGAAKSSNHNNAVIIVPAAQLSTAPRATFDQSTQAFLLHEGTKVEIVDSLINNHNDDSWYEVKVGNKARAWIKAQDIERI